MNATQNAAAALINAHRQFDIVDRACRYISQGAVAAEAAHAEALAIDPDPDGLAEATARALKAARAAHEKILARRAEAEAEVVKAKAAFEALVAA
jgi:hypothetical protein